MFSNLANYLLGSFLNQDEGTAVTPPLTRGEGVESQNHLRLTQDDDWLLVDRDSEGNSEVSSIDDLDNEDIEELSLMTTTTTSPPSTTTNNYTSTALMPYTSINVMDESWFVTPPPCFISTEPVHMETSPLENLLIEHPSMSVYTHHLRRHMPTLQIVSLPQPPPPPQQAIVNHLDEVVEEEDDEERDDVVDRVIVHRRVNRMQMIQQQEKQSLKRKQAQKMQIQKACQYMQRSYLERNNKAREINSRNQRQRRGERSQGALRSHANNNRKC